MRPALEVADVFRHHGEAFRHSRAGHLGRVECRVMSAIEQCRTAALGGHAEQCGDCGLVRQAYNSCRNRHCPKCQGLARAEWLEARQAELLPVPYYHLVFTVPPQVAEIAFQNKRVVYAILFRAAAEALHDIAAESLPPRCGGRCGRGAAYVGPDAAAPPPSALHRARRRLIAGPDALGAMPARIFLPVRVLSRRFRTLFLAQLQAVFAAGELRFSGALAALEAPAAFAERVGALRGIDWVVYSKRPFAGPDQVLAYLGRYTHRVAIANSRLTALQDGQVSFTWKDYRQEAKTNVMTLPADEFMRRFLLHTVPDGFHRIRHVGFLANGHRTAKLALCRALLAAPTPEPPPSEGYRERHRRLTGHDLTICPDCGGPMQERGPLPRHPPPRPAFWCDSS